MEYFRHIMEVVGTSVDGVGVFIVCSWHGVATVRLALIVHTTLQLLFPLTAGSGARDSARLEFLIAGDIIRTVVVAPTLQNVVVLD